MCFAYRKLIRDSLKSIRWIWQTLCIVFKFTSSFKKLVSKRKISANWGRCVVPLTMEPAKTEVRLRFPKKLNIKSKCFWFLPYYRSKKVILLCICAGYRNNIKGINVYSGGSFIERKWLQQNKIYIQIKC